MGMSHRSAIFHIIISLKGKCVLKLNTSNKVYYIFCVGTNVQEQHMHTLNLTKKWVIPTVLDVPTLLIRYTLFLKIVEQKGDL